MLLVQADEFGLVGVGGIRDLLFNVVAAGCSDIRGEAGDPLFVEGKASEVSYARTRCCKRTAERKEAHIVFE